MLCSSEKKFFPWIKKDKVNPYLTIYTLPRIYITFWINGRILRGIIATIFGIANEYDIIHAAVPIQLETNIPALTLKLLGKKVVMDWDDLFYPDTVYAFGPMNHYVRLCEKYAPKIIENIVVVSSYLNKLSLERGAKRVLTLINGINNKQFELKTREEGLKKYNLDPKKKYFVSFGNTMGAHRMEAFANLYYKIFQLNKSEIRLIMNYDIHPFLNSNKSKYKKDFDLFYKSITNIGYIKPDELGYSLAAATATLFATPYEVGEKACFPIRIGSFWQGESVLVTNDNESEHASIIKKTKCGIVERGDDLIASKVKEMLDDDKVYAKYKKNTMLVKKNYAWDVIISDLVDFYKQVLKS